MIYYRISCAPFTVRSDEEKKAFIDIINADENFSKHLICRGVNAEQFTGRVNTVLVGEKENTNKVYVFNCEGTFPTLKLYSKRSAVVYDIEFPTNVSGQTVLGREPQEKKPEVVVEQPKTPESNDKEVDVIKEPVETVEKKHEEHKEEVEEPVEVVEKKQEEPKEEVKVTEHPETIDSMESPVKQEEPERTPEVNEFHADKECDDSNDVPTEDEQSSSDEETNRSKKRSRKKRN